MKAVFLMLGVGIMTWTASAQTTKNFIDQPYIEVNGMGDTMITPNEIFVDVIVSENDTKDKKSIEELEQKLVSALKNMGINTDKDLVTKSFNSKFNWINFTTKVVKTKTYQVKVTSGAMLNKLFNTLEAAKIANAMVSKISHTDIINIQMACRTKAIRNARAKATALISPLGQTVGPAIFISNYSTAFERKLGNPEQGYAGGKKIMVRTEDSFGDNGIEFEQIKVEEIVEARFVLK